MSTVLHPKCGQRFPSGNRAGHCGKCCRTFIGAAAFDMHLERTDSHPIHRNPADLIDTSKEKHFWKDENGYWHFSKPLSQAEKDEIFGGRT